MYFHCVMKKKGLLVCGRSPQLGCTQLTREGTALLLQARHSSVTVVGLSGKEFQYRTEKWHTGARKRRQITRVPTQA